MYKQPFYSTNKPNKPWPSPKWLDAQWWKHKLFGWIPSWIFKTINLILFILMIILFFNIPKYDGNQTLEIHLSNGEVIEVNLPNSTGNAIYRASRDKELSNDDIQNLREHVTEPDAKVVYEAFRRQWYENKGWQDPALSSAVFNDSIKFINQVYY